MKLSTLVLIVCLIMLFTAAAFIYYIPVMNVLTGDAVAAGFLAAFGIGWYAGRTVRRRQVRLGLPSIIPVDRAVSKGVR
jgi:hypothetical protein